MYKGILNFDNETRKIIDNSCRCVLYYQDGKYLALPDKPLGRNIKGIITRCINQVCLEISNSVSFNGELDIDI